MNIRKRVEVENKKNNDSLSIPCYHGNRLCQSRKISIEKDWKKEKKIQIKRKPTERPSR